LSLTPAKLYYGEDVSVSHLANLDSPILPILLLCAEKLGLTFAISGSMAAQKANAGAETSG
jgi:hypothetical protein